MDWRPPNQENWFAAGVRSSARANRSPRTSDSHAYFEIVTSPGQRVHEHPPGPFDYFDLDAQFNFGDKVPLGKAMIRGNLWTKPLGESARPRHVFAIVQHFEYLNTNAYEWGGQSFGPTLYSRFGSPDGIQYPDPRRPARTLLGAVNSDYSFLAEVENRERFREYDYGPGLGATFAAAMVFPNRATLRGRVPGGMARRAQRVGLQHRRLRRIRREPRHPGRTDPRDLPDPQGDVDRRRRAVCSSATASIRCRWSPTSASAIRRCARISCGRLRTESRRKDPALTALAILSSPAFSHPHDPQDSTATASVDTAETVPQRDVGDLARVILRRPVVDRCGRGTAARPFPHDPPQRRIQHGLRSLRRSFDLAGRMAGGSEDHQSVLRSGGRDLFDRGPAQHPVPIGLLSARRSMGAQAGLAVSRHQPAHLRPTSSSSMPRSRRRSGRMPIAISMRG